MRLDWRKCGQQVGPNGEQASKQNHLREPASFRVADEVEAGTSGGAKLGAPVGGIGADLGCVARDQLIDLSDELKRLGDGTAGMPKTDREVREGSWKPKSRDFH